MYFKIDRYTQQRVMLGITTVKCNIKDAADYILSPKMRFNYDNLLKVRVCFAELQLVKLVGDKPPY